jgi:ferredoxin
MDIDKVYAIYLSPTGTTEKVTVATAKGTGLPGARIDLTPWRSRQNYGRSFSPNEIVVVGLPVYGGRLPGRIDNFFGCLKGNQTPAIAMVVYGNRDYEDALIELKIRLEEQGFKVIAAAAFIGEHTFSPNIAAGRPDEGDLKIARELGQTAMAHIDTFYAGALTVKGSYPYVKPIFDPTVVQGDRYTGWAQVGTAADCSFCGLCEENCPWGAITINDNVITNYAKCMRCFRCIRLCSTKAKKVIDPNFPVWVEKFEKRLEGRRCEPELFFGE